MNIVLGGVATSDDTYEIIGGGAFRRLERAIHVARDDARDLSRRLAVILVVTYGPLVATGVARRATTEAWPIVLDEASTHVRILVALPLLLLGEVLMDRRAADAGHYLLRSGLVGPQRRERLRARIAQTARLRDSSLAEAVLVLLTIATVAAYPVFTRDTGADSGWSVLPSVFFTRFLLFRLLWRWLLWGVYLGRLVRLPLECRVSHPDRVAGLAPLAGPSFGFALAVAAVGASLAASWGDRMRFEGVSAKTLVGPVGAFAVIALVVACAPLVMLTAPLFRLRWRGVHEVGAFASRYSEAFERRWLDADGDTALGASAIQSMNDLGGTFERVERIRLFAVPVALLRMLAASIVVPFLPLVVAEVGVKELLKRLAHALL